MRRASIQPRSFGCVIELFHQLSVSIMKNSPIVKEWILIWEIEMGEQEKNGSVTFPPPSEDNINVSALSGGDMMNCIYAAD